MNVGVEGTPLPIVDALWIEVAGAVPWPPFPSSAQPHSSRVDGVDPGRLARLLVLAGLLAAAPHVEELVFGACD